MALYPQTTPQPPPAPPAPQPPPAPPANNTNINGIGGGFWGNLVNNLTGSNKPAVTPIATAAPLSEAQQNTNKMLMIFAFILVFFGMGALLYFGFKKS